jgi:hypothetical protein
VNFLVCPTPVRSRFGEQDKLPIEIEQKDHGFLLMSIGPDDQARLVSVFPDGTQVEIPQPFPEFTYADAPINFEPLARVAPRGGKPNLGFEDGLDGWYTSYERLTTENPPLERIVVSDPVSESSHSLKMRLSGRDSCSVYRVLPLTRRVGDYVFTVDVRGESPAGGEPSRIGPGGQVESDERAAASAPLEAFVKISLIRGGVPLTDTDICLGAGWGEGASPSELELAAHGKTIEQADVIGHGEYQTPADHSIIAVPLSPKAWRTVTVNFSGRPAAEERVDKALVVLCVTRQSGGAVYFDNIQFRLDETR